MSRLLCLAGLSLVLFGCDPATMPEDAELGGSAERSLCDPVSPECGVDCTLAVDAFDDEDWCWCQDDSLQFGREFPWASVSCDPVHPVLDVDWGEDVCVLTICPADE